MMSIGGGNPMFDGLAVGANQQNAPSTGGVASTTPTSATTTTPSTRNNEGQNQNQSGGAQGQK